VELRVRSAVREDLDALLRLYEQLYPEVERPQGVSDARIWESVEAVPGRSVLVAEMPQLPQRLVGTIDVTVMPNLPRRGQPVLLVENVVVDAAHRGAGVGRALMGAAMDIARAAGCYKVQLSAADPEAYRFYKAMGLERGGRVYKRYLPSSPP
jgi:GNAT superfamily N-acetyltransferase